MARHYRRKNAARIKRILTATSVMSWAAFEMRWNTRRNQFRLSAKQTSLFKLAGASVQSTTGSRGVRISGSNGINAGYTMFRGSVKGTGYPLHSPVSLSLPLPRASPCAITFQLESTTVYAHVPLVGGRLPGVLLAR